jgi:hypothetical protein
VLFTSTREGGLGVIQVDGMRDVVGPQTNTPACMFIVLRLVLDLHSVLRNSNIRDGFGGFFF